MSSPNSQNLRRRQHEIQDIHVFYRDDLIRVFVDVADLPANREFFLGALQGEAAARDALLAFAKALEMGEDGLRAYEPTPGCQAFQPMLPGWPSMALPPTSPPLSSST